MKKNYVNSTLLCFPDVWSYYSEFQFSLLLLLANLLCLIINIKNTLINIDNTVLNNLFCLIDALENRSTLHLLKNENQNLSVATEQLIDITPHFDTLIRGGMYEYHTSRGQNSLRKCWHDLKRINLRLVLHNMFFSISLTMWLFTWVHCKVKRKNIYSNV